MPPERAHDLPACLFAALRALGTAQHPRSQRRAFRRRVTDVAASAAFWLHLARAMFPDEEDFLRWSGQSPRQQWQAVLAAWCNQVQCPDARRRRGRLLQSLQGGEVIPSLSPSVQREIVGLCHLGLWHRQSGLTPLGECLLRQREPIPIPAPAAWEVTPTHVRVPYPACWAALWQLETFLTPTRPGFYPISEDALCRLRRTGRGDALWRLLSQQSALPLPGALTARLTAEPPVRVLSGTVLLFARMDDFQAWLQTAAQQAGEYWVLAPGKVLVPAGQAEGLLYWLQQRGLWIAKGVPPPVPSPAQATHGLPAPPNQPKEWPAYLEEVIRRGGDVRLRYRDGGWRRVTPLSLDIRDGVAYLTAFCHRRMARRCFRLDRVLALAGAG